MPFRPTFTCLWCGADHAVRGPDDLEGWAQLCPTCLGRAGDNEFLRMRLRAALSDRAAATRLAFTAHEPADEPADEPAGEPAPEPVAKSADAPDLDREVAAYYAARAPKYDDWYLRRGRYRRGPVHDLAWQVDLDAATAWLDGLPLAGEIVELAAGTGWWAPLLAEKGRLSIYDIVEAPLELARQRLLAHGLRAHIHVRDAWAEPDRAVDGLFTGFWLGHVPPARLGEFLRLALRWLAPDGTYAFIDSRRDPESGAVDEPASPDGEVSVRRPADGREVTIPTVLQGPRELESALRDAGFRDVDVSTTSRFFLLGRARA